MGKIELTYGRTIKTIMSISNPIKKIILKTHCVTHKFINYNAIKILNNESIYDISTFMSSNIRYLNQGVVWADLDYKSSNHFYNIDTLKGLYGFSNLLKEFKKFYGIAISYLEKDCMDKSLFYLGAALHLIQDATIPQHGSVDLFNEHRKFELWIISKLEVESNFIANNGIIRFNRLDDYIIQNIKFAQQVAKDNKYVEDTEERYRNISYEIIRRAQQTTAGFLMDFHERIINRQELFNN